MLVSFSPEPFLLNHYGYYTSYFLPWWEKGKCLASLSRKGILRYKYSLYRSSANVIFSLSLGPQSGLLLWLDLIFLLIFLLFIWEQKEKKKKTVSYQLSVCFASSKIFVTSLPCGLFFSHYFCLYSFVYFKPLPSIIYIRFQEEIEKN